MSKDRVAIVAGVRTPFAKQSTAYSKLTALDLGKLAVAELLQRAGIKPNEIEVLVYGQVIPSLVRAEHRARNRARRGSAAQRRCLQRVGGVRHELSYPP